ncbi:MAG TPA: hypothetical protein VF114_03945, partial [Candidatus Limnocylindria bacterium]
MPAWFRRFRPLFRTAHPWASSACGAWLGSDEADGEASAEEDGSGESLVSAIDAEGLGSVDATEDDGVGVADAAAPSPPRTARLNASRAITTTA